MTPVRLAEVAVLGSWWSTPDDATLWQLVTEICDLDDPAQMLLAIAAMLTTMIGCDTVWRTRLDLASGTAVVLAGDRTAMAVDPALSHALARFGGQHPAVASYLADPLDLAPRRLSDVTDARAWRSSPAYADLSARSAARHQLSLVTSLRPGVGEGWVLVRRARDFSPSDLDVAARVLPALTALDRLVVSRRVAGGRVRVEAGPVVGPELSVREREVLALVAEGLTATAIGRRLGIAPTTVRKHLERVYGKLGHHDRLTAVLHARRAGLLPDA